MNFKETGSRLSILLNLSALTTVFGLLFTSVHAQVSFLPYQRIQTGSWPQAVTVTDLNNDSLDDIILVTGFWSDTANDFRVFIYYQDTAGQLQLPVKIRYSASFPETETVSVGDLNNDSRKDIVIGHGDSLGIFFQNSTGSFDPLVHYYSGNDIDGLKVGDLNNDGLDDIAVSHWNDATIKVFIQSGLGLTAYIYTKVIAGYDELDIGDVTGDGLNDVVFMSGGNPGSLHVYAQNAAGNLNAPVNYANTSPFTAFFGGFGIGDLNNDGRKDIAVSLENNRPNTGMFLFFQDTISGVLQSPVLAPAYEIPDPVDIADLNCDGRNEIVTLNAGWERASVYEQNSSGQYNSYTLFTTGYTSYYAPQTLCTGDINHDGRKDILIASQAGLEILMNNTMPQTMIVYDTLVETDTVTSLFVNNRIFSESNTLLSSPTCSIIVTDSIREMVSYRIDDYRVDSTFYRSGMLCNYVTLDTVFHSDFFARDSIFMYTNTMLISHNVDTVLYSGADFTLSANLKTFPVPTEHYLVLDISDPCFQLYNEEEVHMEIFDALGKRIHTRTFFTSDLPIQVDLSEQAAGVYFLQIVSGSQAFNRTIVKCH